MTAIMQDAVTPRMRVNYKPSRLSVWLEERVLQHNIKLLRNDLEGVLTAAKSLDASVPKKLDDLFKLLDYQSKRGFERREKLHWALVLINWQVFWGVMIVAAAITLLYMVTHG